MKIRMTETRHGSTDGLTVLTYVAGQDYDMSATEQHGWLAKVFLDNGWAEAVGGVVTSIPADLVVTSDVMPLDAPQPSVVMPVEVQINGDFDFESRIETTVTAEGVTTTRRPRRSRAKSNTEA